MRFEPQTNNNKPHSQTTWLTRDELTELILIQHKKVLKEYIYSFCMMNLTYIKVHQMPLISTTIFVPVLKFAICQDNNLCKI